jgi:hypothetical protein
MEAQRAMLSATYASATALWPRRPRIGTNLSVHRLIHRARIKTRTGRSARAEDSRLTRATFHLVIFIIAFVIVCSRRPDVILNPQFYAEDGAYWFADAYRLGLHSLLLPQTSYLHTLTRMVALLTLLVPFSYAPLVMNISAIAVQILPVNVLLSSRFANLDLRIRLLVSFIYLALPNTFETSANLSNIQWRLAVLAFLVLIAERPSNWGWKIFDGTVFVLTSLDGPMGILLVPVAAALWWKRREKWQTATLWLLAPGATVQAITVLTHLHARIAPHITVAGEVVVDGGPNGATFARLISILGRQIFFSSLLGLNAQNWFLDLPATAFFEAFAAAIGVAVLVYALRYAAIELKSFVLFAFATLALTLARPLAGTPDRLQWDWLSVPACGNRYYFLPMLAFLASLSWIATRKASHVAIRSLAIALLCLLPIGIYQDWSYQPFVDYHFQRYAQRFEHAPAGTKVSIPINPGWRMELTKR